MSFNGCYDKLMDSGYNEILTCSYCGSMPSGIYKNCDNCGAKVRRGKRIEVTTMMDKEAKYIEVEAFG